MIDFIQNIKTLIRHIDTKTQQTKLHNKNSYIVIKTVTTTIKKKFFLQKA